MTKKIGLALTAITLTIGFSGCAHKMIQTPANMVYNGNQVDYSTIDTLKKSTLCYKLGDADKDTSIITAAKNAQISKIKHIDTEFKYKTFLLWDYDRQSCITVYGE